MKCNVYDFEAYKKVLRPDTKTAVARLIADKLEYERRSMVYNQIREHDETMDYI